MYISIVEVENNRITKFAEFDTPEAAQSHCDLYGGFPYEGSYSPALYVEGQTVTVQQEQETAEQVIARLERALDRHLDAVANSYRYESIRTMVTYATSEHPTFGPEGRAAVKFRDAVYAHGIQKIADCTREVDPDPIPTVEELIAGLPPITDYFE